MGAKGTGEGIDGGIDPVFRRLLDDYEALFEELSEDGEAFSARFESSVQDRRFLPASIVDRSALSVAVLDVAAGNITFTSPGCDDALIGAIDWDVAQGVARTGASRVEAVDGPIPVLAYITILDARRWDLPAVPANLLANGSGARVIAVAPTGAGQGGLAWACRAFNFSPLESRAVMAAVMVPNMKRAAAGAGMSYDTMRQAISSAMAKAGAPNLSGLVQEVSLLAMGVFPDQGVREAVLADLWGLTARQAALAALLAQGLSRSTAARALAISDATAKKEANAIFEATGSTSAPDLSRKIAGALAMSTLAGASKGQVNWVDRATAPLRFVKRADESRIALSDFGPREGKPVLILHSSMSSRHPPRGLVAELAARGFRPIAIDRPGYGLSDLEVGSDGGAVPDPFGPAARDMARVLDALRIPSVDIVARGGAQAALAFGTLYPERCGKVLLVNPDPPTKRENRREGPIGLFKELYLRSPRLIGLAGHFLARQLNRATIEKMMHRAMDASEADREYLEDPAIIEDYYRGVRSFAAGKLQGYIREQTWLATQEDEPYRPSAGSWKVLVSGHDTFSDPAATAAYFANLLPQADVEMVPDGGRLLAYARPDVVVDALDKIGL